MILESCCYYPPLEPVSTHCFQCFITFTGCRQSPVATRRPLPSSAIPGVSSWAQQLPTVTGRHSQSPTVPLLEIAVDGRTWCGMCPLSLAAEAYVHTSQRTRKLSKCFHPTCFSFLHIFSTQHIFLPVHNFPQVFPSTKLSLINHDSHLHLSGFSPLRKIPTVNHYLRKQDFQHPRCRL